MTTKRLQCLECGSHTTSDMCGTCLSHRLGPVDGPGGSRREGGSRLLTTTPALRLTGRRLSGRRLSLSHTR